MGLLAKELAGLGGKVFGVLPRALVDICGPLIGETVLVDDMHTRKRVMSQM